MSIWLKSDPAHFSEAHHVFLSPVHQNSIACLYTELIFKQTQDNPEIDQEHSTFQICTYTFKDAIFARYTDGGNIMCSLLSQCLHSCTVPDLIQVPLDCSLGLCLIAIQKSLIGSLLRPPNLFCHNEPGVCSDVFSYLFLLIFFITLGIYHLLCSSWSCRQVGTLTCQSILCQTLFFSPAFLPNQSVISSDSSTGMLLLMQCFCLFFNKPWLSCPFAYTYCYFTPKSFIKKLIDHSTKLPWPTLMLQQEKCSTTTNYRQQSLTKPTKPEPEPYTLFCLLPVQLDLYFVPAFMQLSLFWDTFHTNRVNSFADVPGFLLSLWCACIQISLECLAVHVTCLEMHVSPV